MKDQELRARFNQERHENEKEHEILEREVDSIRKRLYELEELLAKHYHDANDGEKPRIDKAIGEFL